MKRQFMHSDECAKLIRTTLGNVHTLASRRKIPHFKTGHRLLFDRDEILAWLEAQRRVSADEAIRTTNSKHAGARRPKRRQQRVA